MILPGQTLTVTASWRYEGTDISSLSLSAIAPSGVVEVRDIRWRQGNSWVRINPLSGSHIGPLQADEEGEIQAVLYAVPSVPWGTVTDVWLQWHAADYQETTLLATLAFPPDHMPAVGGNTSASEGALCPP